MARAALRFMCVGCSRSCSASMIKKSKSPKRAILESGIVFTSGIYASEEEVTEAIKASQRFAPTGTYDASIYATFVEKRLGKLGMTEKDLREIVRESLCLNQLISIVGGGLIAPRSGVAI